MRGCPDLFGLVYHHLYPRPTPNDPPNFNEVIRWYIVPEVRKEVLAYYGHVRTEEARYPGLDYSCPKHRARLARWPFHRRLLAAFDALRLTPFEISVITCWEGTKWAQDVHIHQTGRPVHDSASDFMPYWAYGAERPVYRQSGLVVPRGHMRSRSERFRDVEPEADGELPRRVYRRSPHPSGPLSRRRQQPAPPTQARRTHTPPPPQRWRRLRDARSGESYHNSPREYHDDGSVCHDDEVEDDDDDDEPDEIVSIGEPLNQRLRAIAEGRDPGDPMETSPEWQRWFAWFKNSADRGNVPQPHDAIAQADRA